MRKYLREENFEVAKIRFMKDSEPRGPNLKMEQIKRHETLE